MPAAPARTGSAERLTEDAWQRSPDSRKQAPSLRPGDLVAGRYLLEAPVGSAALGDGPDDGLRSSPAVLWRATDEVLARPVAVKVLCTGQACGRGAEPDPLAGEPFLQAAAAAGRLTGTVLARVYDAAAQDWPLAGHPGRLAYVIREWVDGRDLASVLREDGPVDPVTACRLVATAAEALESAHARGVVHGRLHPGNVLLLPDGRIKITDTATSAALPDRGVPAQRSGDPHGPAADVRDLTAVLYALLTGRWPVGATPQPSCGVPAAPTTSDGRRRAGSPARGRCAPACPARSTTWCTGSWNRRPHPAARRRRRGWRTPWTQRCPSSGRLARRGADRAAAAPPRWSGAWSSCCSRVAAGRWAVVTS
jgi:hypothetical protein